MISKRRRAATGEGDGDMSQGAPEMGQGERTLTRAAGLVADAKQDFDGLSKALEGQIAGLQGKWQGQGGAAFFTLHQAWTEKQRVITNALNDFEASLTSTERDNMSTDDTQSANYNRVSSRLG
jgi:WXG100 family type VII secretion target